MRFARLSPLSIIENIGVSILRKEANCLCSTPFSSLNSFIFCPNSILNSIRLDSIFCLFSKSFMFIASAMINKCSNIAISHDMFCNLLFVA